MPIRYGLPVLGKMRRTSSAPCGDFVFDQADGARHGARIPLEDAIGQRGAFGHASSCRAMTSRWISLVPSPIVSSFTSRKYFSAG